MKQYTTPEQTAKLIELRFEKPKNTQYIQRAKARNLHSPFIEFGEPEFEGSYTIGELIEMLPPIIDEYSSKVISGGGMWSVHYKRIFESRYDTHAKELIDALYAMILLLKEEGVI